MFFVSLTDLQLAAELGKTLLERNKELEVALKQHQNVIEDQAQEIEYLTKQTVALREVSDSRLRIYEQLEVSIQDLERANHRLIIENTAGKKHIKSLTANVETLETKCEDLQTTIDDIRVQMDVLKKRAHKPQETPTAKTPPNTISLKHIERQNEKVVIEKNVQHDFAEKEDLNILELGNMRNSTPHKAVPGKCNENIEEVAQLLAQLRENKTQTSRDQRRITELEEQLATIIQQNQALENQVIQMNYREDDVKSMYDELSTLEEVR